MATVKGTIYLNGCNFQLSYDLLSQDPTTNTSRVRFYGTLNVTNNYISWSSGSAWLHNTTVNIGTYYSRGSYTLVTADYTFQHNNDGNLTIQVGYGLNTTFVSGNALCDAITLPKITRYAVITNSPVSFTDEENPWFTFNNPTNATLRCWLEPKPVGTHYAERTIPAKSGTYTWELTEEERDQLRSACIDNTSCVCRIGLFSTIGTTTGSSVVDRTLNIINASPTFTYALEETNQKVIDVIGSSTANTMIKNVSNIKITVEPTVYKNATVSSVSIVHGGKTYVKTEAPYVFNITPSTNTFDISVTDSRKLTVIEKETRTLIDYEPVTINNFSFKRLNPTSADIIVDLDSNVSQGTFEEVTNTFKVEWKLNDNEYQEIPNSAYDIVDNLLYIHSYVLTNALDYREKGTFFIKLSDIFSETIDSLEVIRGIPVMDWGEHDVQVNGDLFLADQNRENPINIKEYIDSVNVSGTNYIKFASGTMICWGRANQGTHSFPESFISTPVVSAVCNVNQPSTPHVVQSYASTSSVSFECWWWSGNNPTVDSSVPVWYIAIGKYK